MTNYEVAALTGYAETSNKSLQENSLSICYYFQMPLPSPSPDSNFRNGSLTAISIIIGFSLSLLIHWGANRAPWQSVDAFTGLPLAFGILMQVWSPAELLRPESTETQNYLRAKNHFLIGGAGTLIGIGAAGLANLLEHGLH